MKEDFVFPKGIRFATESEIPDSDDKESILHSIEEVNIEEGFTLVESDNDNFKHYSEINISSLRFWEFFEELTLEILPDISALIIGHIDDLNSELFYSPYISTNRIIEILSEYKYELANDVFIKFGIIHQHKEKTEEIFVHPTKHLSVWTNNLNGLITILESFQISKFEKMSFIDEYPRTSFCNYVGQNKSHTEVLTELKEIFNELEDK